MLFRSLIRRHGLQFAPGGHGQALRFGGAFQVVKIIPGFGDGSAHHHHAMVLHEDDIGITDGSRDAVALTLIQGEAIVILIHQGAAIEFQGALPGPDQRRAFQHGKRGGVWHMRMESGLGARLVLLSLLAALARRDISMTTVTLHVGYGTFQPVRVARVEDHRVDAERYAIGPAAADAINRAVSEGRRIVAVGTTTTRVLESVAAAHDGCVVAASGSTDLFIHPVVENVAA